MKLIITFATTCAVLLTAVVNAQTNPPEPPAPPVVNGQNASNLNTTSSSYNTRTHTRTGNKRDNIAISISDNNSHYNLSARFPENKISEVKRIITSELGNPAGTSGTKSYWESSTGEDEVYKVAMRGNKLSVFLDKEVADENLITKIKNMGKLIRQAISGKDVEEEREAQHLQREADRLKREAERMRMESRRMQREAERLKEREEQLKEQNKQVASRYERDAAQLAEEYQRIAAEAERLNRNAINNGAVSDVAARLLKKSSTVMPTPFVNTNNWKWPGAQKALLEKLITDAIITSDSEVIFARNPNGIYINGTRMSPGTQMRYDRLLKTHGIAMIDFFTFYKNGNHIIIVDDQALIEPILIRLQSAGHIATLQTKTSIAINGATVKINGEHITSEKVSEINNILSENNVIGAPGKMLNILGPNNYSLGYTDKDAHLGTLVSNN